MFIFYSITFDIYNSLYSYELYTHSNYKYRMTINKQDKIINYPVRNMRAYRS